MDHNATATNAITDQYKRDGVAKVTELFTHEEVASIRAALSKFIADQLTSLPEEDYVMESDGTSVRNLWRLNHHSEYFRELSEQPRLLSLVRPLVNSNPVVMGVESFNKPARVGSSVPPHQDNAYFCLTPSDALTLWIAIDPVTAANGPVHYIPGSHRQGLRPHIPSGVSGNSMGLAADVSQEDTYEGLLAPGDALIHHSETIHFSAPNTTEQPRCGLLIVYRGEHCVKDPNLLSNYVMAR